MSDQHFETVGDGISTVPEDECFTRISGTALEVIALNRRCAWVLLWSGADYSDSKIVCKSFFWGLETTGYEQGACWCPAAGLRRALSQSGVAWTATGRMAPYLLASIKSVAPTVARVSAT